MAKIKKRIYYHDTDCGGVVYYANYLKYFEEARTEFFQEENIDMPGLLSRGILFAVRSANIRYKKPARYGQIIDAEVKLVKLKSASFQFFQTIKHDKNLLVLAETALACIDKKFTACPIPAKTFNKLKKCLIK